MAEPDARIAALAGLRVPDPGVPGQEGSKVPSICGGKFVEWSNHFGSQGEGVMSRTAVGGKFSRGAALGFFWRFPRGLGAAVAAAVCATALLTGCASPATAPASSAPGSSTPPDAAAPGSSTPAAAPPSATPGPSGDPAPAGTDAPAAEWKTFTTPDGKLSFDHPAEWSVTNAAGASPNSGAFVEVKNANGKPLATLRTNLAVGAECPEKYPFMTYDSEPVPALAQAGVTPRFVYEARSNPAEKDPMKATTFGYGITSAPEPTGATACPIAHFFTWPPGGASFAGIYNPFDTTPGNEPHADTPEAYADTAEYQFIRQMITSLRPAGT